MHNAGFAFIILLTLSGILLALVIFSVWRYRRDQVKGDLRMAKVLLVISMTILGMDLTVVRYDSIRYNGYLEPEGEMTVILPIPNDQELIDEVIRSIGSGMAMMVDTEKGKGLQITLSKLTTFDVDVVERFRSIDHGSDLVDGNLFWIYFEPIDDNATIRIEELRIIHEDTFGLLSDQVFLYPFEDTFNETGWYSFEYQSMNLYE